MEQVLQQRHGIRWNEDAVDYRNPLNPVARMIASDDWYQFVLTQPVDAAPGQKFAYSSGASTLMSRLIRVATGMGPDEFAMQELFTPLGIDQVHWEVYSEDGMGTGLTDWPAPDHDVPLGFSLWLKARDMLKIGQLYLNGGVFLQPDPVTLTPWGSGRFIAIDCSHVSFEFESDEISTTIPLTRITGFCFEPPQ